MQHQKDSLRNVIAQSEGKEKLNAYGRLTNLYYFEADDEQKRDSLFALYDEMDAEAERQGSNGWRGVIRVNKLHVLNSIQQFDAVIKLAPDYLKFIEKLEAWDIYYQLYGPLILAYRNKGNNDEALAVAQKMYEFAKEKKDDTGIGLALYALSRIYGNQRRFTEQENYLRECISIIYDNTPTLNVLANAYSGLGFCLIAQQRYDEAIKIADEYEQIIERYEKASSSYQRSARQNQYLVYLDAYRQSERFDKAEIYCNKLDSISNGTINLYEEKAAIYLWKKQYDKALEMVNKAIETASPINKLQGMGMKMIVLLRKGNAEASEQLFREIVVMRDSIHNKEMNVQLDEIRTQYEVDKITAEKERNRNYFLFALGSCFLLSAALVIWIYHSRTIVRKNRGLYLQIKEQDRLAEELEREREENRKFQQILKPDGAVLPEEDDDLFFGKLTILMKEQRLYANCEIRRQDIAEQIGLSDRGLHDCIKNNTGMSFTEYINTLRLAYARELLSNMDEKFTIDAIAFEVGFNSRATFYRLFNEKYGLSPKQFKQFVK